jgi:drug/metabolite transporter (DMT)-like permease
MHSSKKRFRAYILLLISTIVAAAAFIVVEPALKHATVFQYLFYRFLLAAVLITPWLFHLLKRQKNQRLFWMIFWVEIVGVVIYLPLLYLGLARSTAIETSLLATTTPLFIILAGVVWLKEKQTRREWTGLAISLIGMLIITALPLLNGAVGLSRASIGGNLLIVLSNCAGAAYAILAKAYYRKVPPLLAAGISFWLGTIAFGILSMGFYQLSFSALLSGMVVDLQHPSVLFATIYMAIFCSIIGLITFIKGQKLIEASEAGLFTYLQPLIYLPLGVLLLGEAISIYQILGLGLVLIGVWISETR